MAKSKMEKAGKEKAGKQGAGKLEVAKKLAGKKAAAKKAPTQKAGASNKASAPSFGPVLRIVASGVARVKRIKGGLELRIFSTVEEALAEGVKPEQIEGMDLISGHPLYGVCAMLSGTDGSIQCLDKGCDASCFIIEDSKVVPENLWGKPKGSKTYLMKPGKVYGCKCIKPDLGSGPTF